MRAWVTDVTRCGEARHLALAAVVMSFPARADNIPVVRESTFDDYPQVRDLESQNGLATKDFAEWAGLWTGNPAYLSLQRHWPIGWVIEHGDRVVGSFGNVPLLYQCRGQNVTAAAGRAWVVDPAYRSYAPLLLDRFLRQNADLCFSTTANREASRILTALGAKPVPVGSWDRSEIWITNHRRFARTWLANHQLPTAFTYVLAPALFLKSSITSKAPRRGRRLVHVEWCTGFDERFDEFWETLRNERSGFLLAVRTRQLLEWHFRHALEHKKLWILAATECAKLLAYSIFLEKEDRMEARQLLLVDFQALDDQDEFLFPILAAALKQCQRQGIDLVEKIGLCVGSRKIAVAPHVRKRDAWSYYYKTNNSDLSALLSDPQVWNPSLLDGDSTL